MILATYILFKLRSQEVCVFTSINVSLSIIPLAYKSENPLTHTLTSMVGMQRVQGVPPTHYISSSVV